MIKKCYNQYDDKKSLEAWIENENENYSIC